MRRASFCMARPAVTDVMLMHVPRIHCTGRRRPGSGWPPGIAYGQSGIRPYPIRAAARAAYPPDSLANLPAYSATPPPPSPAAARGISRSPHRRCSPSLAMHSPPVARPPASQPSRVSEGVTSDLPLHLASLLYIYNPTPRTASQRSI